MRLSSLFWPTSTPSHLFNAAIDSENLFPKLNSLFRADMNGKIIELGESPSKSSRGIIEELQKKTPDQKDLTKALKDLTYMAVDPTFAKAFHNLHGLNIILAEVAGGKFREAELGIVLEGVNLLVEHMVESDTLKATTFQQDFIKQLADLTTRDGEQAHNVALGSALNLLAILVKECEDCRSIIDMFVALPNVISLLESHSKRIKLSSISLINALLKHASEERRGDMVMALQERTARNIIVEHLLGVVTTIYTAIYNQSKDTKQKDNARGDHVDGKWADQMSHQLYLLQHHTLSQVVSSKFHLNLISDSHKHVLNDDCFRFRQGCIQRLSHRTARR